MHDTEQLRYAQLGGDYFWFAGKRRLVWSLLEPHLAGRTDLRILDLGCGPGFAWPELRRWGTVVGVDASHAALKQCRQRQSPGAWLINGSAEALPCREQSLSLLVAFDIIEHLDDDVGALKEFCRTLRAGGWLALTVPAFQWLWSDHDTRYQHKRRYRARELREKLEAAGFECMRVTYCQALFLPPLWMMRRIKQLVPGRRRRDDFLGVPGWLNRCLTGLIAGESSLLQHWDAPWGVTIIGLARKRRETVQCG